jgi:hypothetical protein
MAKRPKPPAGQNTPTADQPGNGLPPEVVDPAGRAERIKARDEFEMIDAFREVLGADATITLHRWHPTYPATQAGPMYLATITRDEFSLDLIADRFGGGDFVARAKVNGGQFDGSVRKFRIDHSIPPKNPRAPAEKPAQPDPGSIIRETVEILKPLIPKGGDSGGNVEFFRIMAQMQERSAREAREAQERQSKELRELIANNQAQTNKILEQLAKRDNQTQAAAPKSLVEQAQELAQVREVMAEFMPEVGGGDSDWKKELVGMAREALPVLGQILSQRGAPAGNGPRIRIQAQPGTPAGHAANGAARENPVTISPAQPASALENGAAPSETIQQSPDDMNALIKLALAQFKRGTLKAAALKKDPYDFVCTTLDMVPADYLPRIFEVAHGGEWFTQIFGQHDEQTQRHFGFIKEVRESVLARALVAHAGQFKSVNKSAEETAAQYVGWLPEDATDAIYNWTEPDNWAQLFAGDLIDPAWLENLRVEIDKLLGGEPEADVTPSDYLKNLPSGSFANAAPAEKPVPAPTPAVKAAAPKAGGKKSSAR